jgi:Na+-transporting methylmalonyl-CoA/oxaloacetate decarboxylase gamma subunit
MSTLVSALWITLIGMGLVFIALVLLWGLMALMVNATTKMAEKEAAEVAGETGEVEAAAVEEEIIQPGTALRAKAAAAAIAVALQMQAKTIGQRGSLPAPEPFSAWQSVMRANRLTQKSRTFSRKQ